MRKTEGLRSRVVLALDEIARLGIGTGALPRLTDDVVKGMATLAAHQSIRGWRGNRVVQVWHHVGTLSPAKQAEAFENTMRWIAEGERMQIRGWGRFLANGPGKAFPRNTQGAYAELEYLSTTLKWQNIVELERPAGRCWFVPRIAQTVCQRYIDVVVREPDALGNVREVSKEIKNLRAGASFSFASQVKFDVSRILTASLTENGGVLVSKDLARRLSQLEYVLRGSPDEMAAVINGLTKKIEAALSSVGAEALAVHVKITPLSQPLPI